MPLTKSEKESIIAIVKNQCNLSPNYDDLFMQIEQLKPEHSFILSRKKSVHIRPLKDHVTPNNMKLHAYSLEIAKTKEEKLELIQYLPGKDRPAIPNGEKFKPGTLKGAGSHGSVKECYIYTQNEQEKFTKTKKAIKSIELKGSIQQQHVIFKHIKNEVQTLKAHNYGTGYNMDNCEEKQKFHLHMLLFKGDDLFNVLFENRHNFEQDASLVLIKLISIFETYLHTFQLGLIHRDIKSENVIDQFFNTVLIDFGHTVKGLAILDKELVGTAEVISQKQIKALRNKQKIPYDQETETHALKLLAQELLNYQLNPKLDSDEKLLDAIENGRPIHFRPSLTGLMLDIDKIIEKMDPKQANAIETTLQQLQQLLNKCFDAFKDNTSYFELKDKFSSIVQSISPQNKNQIYWLKVFVNECYHILLCMHQQKFRDNTTLFDHLVHFSMHISTYILPYLDQHNVDALKNTLADLNDKKLHRAFIAATQIYLAPNMQEEAPQITKNLINNYLTDKFTEEQLHLFLSTCENTLKQSSPSSNQLNTSSLYQTLSNQIKELDADLAETITEMTGQEQPFRPYYCMQRYNQNDPSSSSGMSTNPQGKLRY